MVVPADNHVHSEWSYDTTNQASMTGACERALDVGVPAVAFTEHLDFTRWATGDPGRAAGLEPRHRSRVAPLDVTGYLAAIEDCRQRFPALRILSGVETGEPHLFAASVGAVVGNQQFDRILGSLHAVPVRGRLAGLPTMFGMFGPDEVLRRYFAELLRLVRGSDLFQVLAHLDFPRRYWPPSAGPYEEKAFEDQYRAVLRALAESGRALDTGGQHQEPAGLGRVAGLVAGRGRPGRVVRERRASGLADRGPVRRGGGRGRGGRVPAGPGPVRLLAPVRPLAAGRWRRGCWR